MRACRPCWSGSRPRAPAGNSSAAAEQRAGQLAVPHDVPPPRSSGQNGRNVAPSFRVAASAWSAGPQPRTMVRQVTNRMSEHDVLTYLYVSAVSFLIGAEVDAMVTSHGARQAQPTRTRSCSPADGITKADLAAYYEAVAPAMVPHAKQPADEPVALERRHRAPGRRGTAGDPEGRAGVGARSPCRAAAAATSCTRWPTTPTRCAGSPRSTASRRTCGPAASTGSTGRPHDLRPRPARRGRRLRPHPRGRAGDGRAAARARARAVRDDERVARHPRRRAAAAHAGPRRRARAGARDRRGAGRAPPRPANHGVAQEQARGPHPHRHRAQHLRADHGRSLCGARRPGAPVATPLRWEELEDPELRADAFTLAHRCPRASSATATPGRRSGTVNIVAGRSCSGGGASTAIRTRPASGPASSRSSRDDEAPPPAEARARAGGSCARSSPRR